MTIFQNSKPTKLAIFIGFRQVEIELKKSFILWYTFNNTLSGYKTIFRIELVKISN